MWNEEDSFGQFLLKLDNDYIVLTDLLLQKQ